MPKVIDTKLLNIADIRPGHPFRSTIIPTPSAPTHAVQVRDVNEYGEIETRHLITTELKGRKQPDYLKEGDILFVAKGAKHFSTYVRQVPEQSVCSPHFFIVRIQPQHADKVLPEFINWQLNQSFAQRYFINSAEGTLYVSIRRKILEDTPITVPPLVTQQRIVSLHRAAVTEQKVLQQLIINRQQQLNVIANDLFRN
ncbi:MAG: restriction endonuclease subunit S [Methylophaga sp.]|nr:restriction endonuclease subunit S [Methylophaga sp.]